jgi:hypothetical protein
MPYKIKKQGSGYFVVNTKTGKKKNLKAHKTKTKAQKHLTALNINVRESFDSLCNDLLKAYLFETPTPGLSGGSLDLDNNDEHKAAAAEMLKQDPELQNELGKFNQMKKVVDVNTWKTLKPEDQEKIIKVAKERIQQGQKNNAASNIAPALPPTNITSTGGTSNAA